MVVLLVRFGILALAFSLALGGSVLAAGRDNAITGTTGPTPPSLVLSQRLPRALRPSLSLDDSLPRPTAPLAGRTLVAGSVADIVLRPHEVILTFDDGPMPGRTTGVLRILDAFGVKGTFMMVGKMAELHPKVAQAVALDGQTIGTHTYDHPDLTKLAAEAAFDDVWHGERAVAAALAPVNAAPGPFFRFPYLAQNPYLRTSLAWQDTIVLGVQIDSDDYMRSTPQVTLKHLLARLDKMGKGIVLFHDIHPKTLVVLPEFLHALADRGYSVVRLVGKGRGAFAAPVITASR